MIPRIDEGRICRSIADEGAWCRLVGLPTLKQAQVLVFAARLRPSYARNSFARCKQRARRMPGAQCTLLVCAGGTEYAHQYSQRRHRKHPPHAMVLRLIRDLGERQQASSTLRSFLERWTSLASGIIPMLNHDSRSKESGY